MRIIQIHFLILFVLCAVHSLAQQQKPDHDVYLPKKFIDEFEIYGGLGLSAIRGWDLNNVERKIKVGYTFGLGASHHVSPRVKINGKLFFEKKGTIAEVSGLYFDEISQTLKEGKSTDDFNFHYYTLAILPTYTINRFELGIGPYTSYLDKLILNQHYSFNGSRSSTDLTDYYTQFDFGITANIGYKIPIKENIDLSFQLLHTQGLIDIASNSSDGQKSKTTNTSMIVGITFKR